MQKNIDGLFPPFSFWGFSVPRFWLQMFQHWLLIKRYSILREIWCSFPTQLSANSAWSSSIDVHVATVIYRHWFAMRHPVTDFGGSDLGLDIGRISRSVMIAKVLHADLYSSTLSAWLKTLWVGTLSTKNTWTIHDNSYSYIMLSYPSLPAECLFQCSRKVLMIGSCPVGRKPRLQPIYIYI